jgi:hypothetical protein
VISCGKLEILTGKFILAKNYKEKLFPHSFSKQWWNIGPFKKTVLQAGTAEALNIQYLSYSFRKTVNYCAFRQEQQGRQIPNTL